MSKICFKEWLWEMAVAEINHLHSDNGVLTADMFHEDCKSKPQSQSFSGVGAKHQNSLDERAIQTIMYMARTFMVHISLHWTEYEELMIWLCGVLLSSMLFGFTIVCQTGCRVLLCWNYSPRQRLITEIYSGHMYGVPCVCP